MQKWRQKKGAEEAEKECEELLRRHESAAAHAAELRRQQREHLSRMRAEAAQRVEEENAAEEAQKEAEKQRLFEREIARVAAQADALERLPVMQKSTHAAEEARIALLEEERKNKMALKRQALRTAEAENAKTAALQAELIAQRTNNEEAIFVAEQKRIEVLQRMQQRQCWRRRLCMQRRHPRIHTGAYSPHTHDGGAESREYTHKRELRAQRRKNATMGNIEEEKMDQNRKRKSMFDKSNNGDNVIPRETTNSSEQEQYSSTTETNNNNNNNNNNNPVLSPVQQKKTNRKPPMKPEKRKKVSKKRSKNQKKAAIQAKNASQLLSLFRHSPFFPHLQLKKMQLFC